MVEWVKWGHKKANGKDHFAKMIFIQTVFIHIMKRVLFKSLIGIIRTKMGGGS